MCLRLGDKVFLAVFSAGIQGESAFAGEEDFLETYFGAGHALDLGILDEFISFHFNYGTIEVRTASPVKSITKTYSQV